MNYIIAENLTRNRNGAVNGRGTLRRKLTLAQRAALGADIALGATPLAPSLKQAAAAVGISVFELRRELQSRERAETERRAVQQRLDLQAEAEAANAQADAIVAAWLAASPVAHGVAVRILGTDSVWGALASVVA